MFYSIIIVKERGSWDEDNKKPPEIYSVVVSTIGLSCFSNNNSRASSTSLDLLILVS